MLKKISLAFCIFCISVTSHAYLIKTNFTVENKTDVPLLMEIEQPNGQETLTQPLPAHKIIDTLTLNNNDNTGLLYQTATAPFKSNPQTEKSMLKVVLLIISVHPGGMNTALSILFLLQKASLSIPLISAKPANMEKRLIMQSLLREHRIKH